jgi:hypothetical protein
MLHNTLYVSTYKDAGGIFGTFLCLSDMCFIAAYTLFPLFGVVLYG